MQILLIPTSSNWVLGATGFGAGELLLLLAAIGVIVLICRSRSKIVEASCAACEYPVRGLESDRCPECGGLFSEVGITPAGTKRGMSTLGRCVLWTIALGIISSQITDVVERYAPATSTRKSEVQLEDPESEAYETVEIKFYEHINLSGIVVQEITIQLFVTSDVFSNVAYVNLNDTSIRFEESAKSPTKTALTVESLLDWMQTSLPNTSRQMIRNEAVDVLKTLSSLARNGSLDAGRGLHSAISMNNSNTGSPYRDLTTAILILIWLVGIIILIKQRSKSFLQKDNSSEVKMLY